MARRSSPAQTLRRLEERLLRPEIRKSAAEVAALLSDDFVELASDGRTYGKRQIIASLRSEAPKRYSLKDFRVRILAPGVALATFRLQKRFPKKKETVTSLRSSIWKRIDGRWRMAFHQGTLTADE